jgi:hypothetical protein
VGTEHKKVPGSSRNFEMLTAVFAGHRNFKRPFAARNADNKFDAALRGKINIELKKYARYQIVLLVF